MKFDLDTMPTNLDEAVNQILNSLDDHEEIEAMKDPVGLHFGFGMWLRNNWSLWDRETHLVQWFIKNLGIVHADDISSTILEGVATKLRGEEFDPASHVNYYKEYWRANGLDPATMERI